MLGRRFLKCDGLQSSLDEGRQISLSAVAGTIQSVAAARVGSTKLILDECVIIYPSFRVIP